MSCLFRMFKSSPSSRASQDSGRDSTVVTVTGNSSSAASTLSGKRDAIFANQIYISHGTSLIEYLKQQKDEIKEIVKGHEQTIRDLRDRVIRLETMLKNNTRTSSEILENLDELKTKVEVLPETNERGLLIEKIDVIMAKTRTIRKSFD